MNSVRIGCQTTDNEQFAIGTLGSMSKGERGDLINSIYVMFRREFSGQFLKYEQEVDGWEKYQKTRLYRDEQFNQLTPDQIWQGVHRACKGKFIPGVSELIELCKPSLDQLGMPSVHDAWLECNDHCHEITTHSLSHDVVREVGNKTGWHALRIASTQKAVDQLQRQFTENYKTLVASLNKPNPQTTMQSLEDHSKDCESEKAIRHGKYEIDRLLSEQGIPQRMSAEEALKKLRAAL